MGLHISPRRARRGTAATKVHVERIGHSGICDDTFRLALRDGRYARALAKAMDYLLAAGELFDGTIVLEEGKRRFDLVVPELSLRD